MQSNYNLLEKMNKRIHPIQSNWDKPVPPVKFSFKKNNSSMNYQERDLVRAKDLIGGFSRNKWNFFRDLINPYEFNNIDKVNYINRAYFKLHEMIRVFDIDKEFEGKDIHYSGVCEFPCGFVKCVLDNDLLSKSVKHVNIISNDDNKPKIGHEDKINVDIVDITNKELLKNVLKDKAHKSMFVTSDGGINEGEEYARKEELHYKLKLYEMGTALRLLDVGGTLIIKFFDFFTTPSVEMLYYLSFFFKEIFIYKPVTSRPTNSERYIICKNMIRRESNIVLNIPDNLRGLSSFLDVKIPNDFLSVVKKINESITSTQINNIKFVVEKMENNIDTREKQYFNTKKAREQRMFFQILGVKNL